MAEKSTLAKPYAKAIYDLASQSDAMDKWSDQLRLLGQLSEHQGIADMINNPAIEHSAIVKLFEDIGKDILTEQGRNLIKLASQNSRLDLFKEISDAYEDICIVEQGVIDAEIISAFDVSSEQEEKIKSALEKRFKQTVKINSRTDESLVGGLIIKAGDIVIDGTVNHQLNKITKSLMR